MFQVSHKTCSLQNDKGLYLLHFLHYEDKLQRKIRKWSGKYYYKSNIRKSQHNIEGYSYSGLFSLFSLYCIVLYYYTEGWQEIMNYNVDILQTARHSRQQTYKLLPTFCYWRQKFYKPTTNLGYPLLFLCYLYFIGNQKDCNVLYRNVMVVPFRVEMFIASLCCHQDQRTR